MHARVSQKKQQARITELEEQVARLEQELGPGEDAEKIVNKHIKMLHRYNEAKDAAQILIGRLASLKETTIRQIHKDLDLPTED
ncbi:DNA repair protein [Rhodocollybia butyracea]|uniref:DNA repair protein n=1 Tax=Rhodocollybia butyracea TaxID=206335 RepID=A0A9P5UC77_9AGAR|nr:DNA repair protein [Rhodocollybia butyracea]